MRIILKLLLVPVVLVLSIVVWTAALVLKLSARIFGLAGFLFGIFAAILWMTRGYEKGLPMLLIAFAISPLGFPMLCALLIGRIQALRFWILDTVY